MRRHPSLLRSICPLVLAGALLCPTIAQAQARPANWRDQPLSDELVDQAIRKGIDYIWSKQHPTEHHWEPWTLAQWRQEFDPKQWQGYNGPGSFTGSSSLALLALRMAGASQDDPRFRNALEFIARIQPTQTYARGLRAAMVSSLEPFQGRQPWLQSERDWLIRAAYADGTFGYYSPPNDDIRTKLGGNRDLSNTQYGVLGLWLLGDAGTELPDAYWRAIGDTMVKIQNNDGGWGYAIPGSRTAASTLSMTLAGLANQYIVWDRLFTQRCNQPLPPPLAKSIRDGHAWLDKNFQPVPSGQWRHYIFYGIERVGVAAGTKYFGDVNWYDQGARFLLWSQRDDGGWPAMSHSVAHDVCNTAYSLLFLAYGRAPIVFNKLAYGDMNQWNTRPRDLARLTSWMHKSYERLFNWQVMPIERSVEELLDAPVLMMSGRAAIKLTDEQKQKLREYVLRGGLLLGDAADRSAAFAQSFRQLMAELFPELEMTPLRPDHPILTIQFRLGEPERGRRAIPPLEALSNGVRVLALLSPGDLGCTWQQWEVVGALSHFQLGGNLMQYVSDYGTGLIGRGASYMVRDQGRKPERTVTVGRLVWGGKFQWDPEPYAWDHLDVHLRNAGLIGVATRPVDFSEAVSPADLPLVHLTGLGQFVLTEAQQENLKAYVRDGGLLLVDAAGGNRAFAENFSRLAGQWFGLLAPAATPMHNIAGERGLVQMRHLDNLPRTMRPLQVLAHQNDGKWGVLFLPYDLTAALAGYPNAEPVGMTPETARAFVTELLKWRFPLPAASPAGH